MNRRILFVVEDTFPLGSNLLLGPLVNSLADSDFEVHIVDVSRATIQPGAMADWPAEIHFGSRGTFASRVVWLHQLLRRIDPEIVHVWGNRDQLLSVLAKFGHHSHLIASHFEMPVRRNFVRRLADSCLFGNNTILTASHQTVARRLADEQPERPIRIMPSGITLGPFDRESARQNLLETAAQGGASMEPQTCLIGTVARLEPSYRLKDLIWAIDLLCCVRDDVHLFVFGSGSEAGNLKRFGATTASQQHVHFIPTDRSTANDLAALDVYWNAQIESPLQAAMLTAMSLGIPTVSVKAPETEQAILSLTTALGTNYGARDEFARWTKYLLEQPDSAKQIASQGQTHVEQQFPIAAMNEAYRSLYFLR